MVYVLLGCRRYWVFLRLLELHHVVARIDTLRTYKLEQLTTI